MSVDLSVLPSKRISVSLDNGPYSTANMSTTKQYTPTTTARPTWRDREAQKERQQREAARLAAEEERTRAFAKTEENFPSTMKPVDRMVVHDSPPGKFAQLANKMETDNEATRKAKKDRRQRIAYNPALFIRSGGRKARTYDEEDEYDDNESMVSQETDLNEKYPTHGKRGTCSPPDSEGWRTVTKKARKQKRELTEAELVKKYREEFFGENGEQEEDADMNADLNERNQRREFY